MKKKCMKCGVIQNLNSFYAHKGMADGHINKCKSCAKSDVKLNSEKVGSKYDFSEIGVIRIIYKTQKRNNKLRGHGVMPYSKTELSEWLYNNDFKKIYDYWVKYGWIIKLKPSVDRLDDFKGYSFDNIKLSTWNDNIIHSVQDRMNGIGTCGLSCKMLYKYDGVKNLIATYVSYWSAARDMGYSLEYPIKKEKKCRNGYFWTYEPF